MALMTAIEQTALEAMRTAVASGWNDESLMIDAAISRLTLDGMDHDNADAVAQIVYNTHFRIMGAN